MTGTESKTQDKRNQAPPNCTYKHCACPHSTGWQQRAEHSISTQSFVSTDTPANIQGTPLLLTPYMQLYRIVGSFVARKPAANYPKA